MHICPRKCIHAMHSNTERPLTTHVRSTTIQRYCRSRWRPHKRHQDLPSLISASPHTLHIQGRWLAHCPPNNKQSGERKFSPHVHLYLPSTKRLVRAQLIWLQCGCDGIQCALCNALIGNKRARDSLAPDWSQLLWYFPSQRPTVLIETSTPIDVYIHYDS